MHRVSLGLHQHFVYNPAIIRSTWVKNTILFIWYLLLMSMQNKHHIQVPLLLPKSEKQFYDVKTIFREQIVLLVKGLQKGPGTFYKLLSGRSSLPFPSKVCKTFYKWLSSRSKRFFPSCLSLLAHDILDHWHRCQRRRNERGGDTLYMKMTIKHKYWDTDANT